MPEIIVPSPMVGLLAAFEPCFHAPSYRIFRLVLAGWMHCLGRRTVTAVALASGGVGQRHISVFHRFFTRATWSTPCSRSTWDQRMPQASLARRPCR